MMIKTCFPYLILIFLSCACNNPEKRKTKTGVTTTELNQMVKPDYQIGCEQVAGITKSDQANILQQKFSVNRLTTDSLFLEGTFERLVTTIDKGLKTELIIHWNNDKSIKFIEIKHSQSPYHLANGLKIGSALQDLVKVNGRAINFYGFGWDYGGTTISFNNGNITKSDPCFSGVFALGKQQNLKNQNQFALINGDRPLNSDNKLLDDFKIHLSVIRIRMN